MPKLIRTDELTLRSRPLINTQLQLGDQRNEGRAKPFQRFPGGRAGESLLGGWMKTVETVVIASPAPATQLKLGVNERALSKTGFHLRLRGGGVGVVNLAHLTSYTAYPGVVQVPSGGWLAEPVTNK